MYLLERIKDGNDWKKGDKVWSDIKLPGWRVIESTGKKKEKREQKENIIKKRLEASGPLFFLPIPYKNQLETAS